MKLSSFEISDHFYNERMIAAYLTAALEDSDPDLFLMAMADVAKARGMANVVRDSVLAPGAKMRFETVLKLLDSLGVRLIAVPR